MAERGMIVGYGADQKYSWRRAAYFVDRILQGGKPAEIPIEQPTKFRTTVNLKTAAAIGVEVPAIVLASADEVIE